MKSFKSPDKNLILNPVLHRKPVKGNQYRCDMGKLLWTVSSILQQHFGPAGDDLLTLRKYKSRWNQNNQS